MIQDLWPKWQEDWRRMEALARQRGWQVTPLAIAPPASKAEIKRAEKEAGTAFPRQFREVLTQCSAAVRFGWGIPMEADPMELSRLPTGSSLRDHVWDLAHIREYAIPGFQGWKKHLAGQDVSEAPNHPGMWRNQFPIADLVNGDMLTIDVSKPDGPQPVRYFSHELEGLHGRALAPDFFSFVTVLSQLGWAGTEQDSWFGFLAPKEGDKHYLSTEAEGSRKWLAWLAKDPNTPDPDEPPPSIIAQSSAERALLLSAEANLDIGVVAALDAGARPDVIRDQKWLTDKMAWSDHKYATAVTHAVRNSNIPLLEILVKRGASLNTRRLALGEAVMTGSLETVHWLIAHGARVNGWKDQRHWPLHFVARHNRRDDVLPVLEALLQAGADPNAPWDNGLTMLMRAEPEVAKRLLAHGADVHRRNALGQTALHVTGSAEMVRLLASHGADVNALSTSKKIVARTPLHAQLIRRPLTETEVDQLPQMRWEIVRTLVELGADPKLRDGAGRSTLAYCDTVEDFELIQAYGLDPFERLPDGGTLLHLLAARAHHLSDEYGALFQHLLKLGLDINAVDGRGRTALHLKAQGEYTSPKDIDTMLAAGADKSIRDSKGLRAYDYVPRSGTNVRKRLMVAEKRDQPRSQKRKS